MTNLRVLWIARAVPVILNEIEVFIEFHIFAILEFDLLIGYSLENLFHIKPSLGSPYEKFGKTASATHLEIPMAKHLPNHDLFEEAKFISPFISPELAYETEHIPPTSLEHKPCPFGHKHVVLDSDRDSTLILHGRFCAMDMPKAPILETEEKDSTKEHKGLCFETPQNL
jgi:hypothetical protein